MESKELIPLYTAIFHTRRNILRLEFLKRSLSPPNITRYANSMTHKRSNSPRRQKHQINSPTAADATNLRIIGGDLRGRPVQYSGEQHTRPMKNRVREAMFNLIGPLVKGTFTLDLFAGTGAVALESISRGSVGALCIEKHFPTVRLINDNICNLGVDGIATVTGGDAFHWVEHRMLEEFSPPENTCWSIFFCPPYAFFVDRKQEMLDMIQTMINRFPAGSHIIVECDEHFDPQELPNPELWDVRSYPPAVIALRRGTNPITTTDNQSGD